MVRFLAVVLLLVGVWLLHQHDQSAQALAFLIGAAWLLVREGRQLLEHHRSQPGGSRRRRTPHLGQPVV